MFAKLATSLCFIWCVFALTPAGSAQDRWPRIINGDPTNEFESVGIVGSINRGGFCTGTLISPFHVLTAAHCAEIIAASDEATFEVGGQIYFATTILVHPDYDAQDLTNDLAILELADPVTDVVPMELLRSSPVVGDELTIVGYGSGGDAQGSDGSFGFKQVSTTPVDDLTATEVIWRFDDPEEGNSAAGDSGGPGLLDIDGVYYLAAIVSSGTNPFSALGDVAFNMRVDAYVDWIDAVVGTFDPGDDPDSNEEPSDEDPTDEDPTDEDPTDEDPTDEDPTDDGPSEPEPTEEASSGCKFDFGSLNWHPQLALKPSRGQSFRRPSWHPQLAFKPSRGQTFRRRPSRHLPSRLTDRVGVSRTNVSRTSAHSAVRPDAGKTEGRQALSSRSPRRSR